MARTVAELLVAELAAAGVREVYSVAGGALTPLLGALAAQQEVAYVGVRHEFAAAAMAAATTQGTGRLAVCLGEQGPGTLNVVSGLGIAHNNRLPVLVLTVSGASPLGSGALMELDATLATRAVTKAQWQVRRPEDAVPALRAALAAATSGRPGPVHVDVTRDVIGAPAPDPEPAAPTSLEVSGRRQRGVFTGAASSAGTGLGGVSEAAALLQGAERPLVIAGGGAVDAATPLRAIAARLGAVTVTTQMGMGVLPVDGPLFAGQGGIIGGPALLRAATEADVVLAVGCRESSWWWRESRSLLAGATVIHVDVDPVVLARADVALDGDAAVVCEALLAELAPAEPTAWARAVHADQLAHRDAVAELAASRTDPIHPAALAAATAALMTSDDLLVLDGGHTTFWANDVADAREPRTVFHEPGMGHLGFGVPYANALARAYPERRVVTVTGDGAFGFSLVELDTARRLGLRTITVVHDNARWGVIGLAQSHAGFSLGTELEGTDYAAVARGFGCLGIRVADLADLPDAWAQALASDVPAVIDVEVSFVPHPMMPEFARATAPSR